jgi:hypothetical protein
MDLPVNKRASLVAMNGDDVTMKRDGAKASETMRGINEGSLL